jgi:hypothetical protein
MGQGMPSKRNNEYLLTIRLTTKTTLDPEAVRRIEAKVAELLRNTIWEASGVASIEGQLWGRHGEGEL